MLQRNQIHTMDCFQAMNDIPDESVDAVITDPPYPNGIGAFTDSLVDGIAMVYLACKKAKNYVVFFWKPSDVPKPPAGWFEIARHIWHKPDAASRTKYEAIVVWSKERKYRSSRVWNVPILSLRTLGDWKPHPTQKPVLLMRFIVEEYTNPGELVLDPFVGVGATAIACQQLARDYIGIDKDAEFTKIARERLNKPKYNRSETLPEQLDVEHERPAEAKRTKKR